MIAWGTFVTLAVVYFGIYTTVLHLKIDRLERTPGPPGPPGPMGMMGPKGAPGEPAPQYHYVPPTYWYDKDR